MRDVEPHCYRLRWRQPPHRRRVASMSLFAKDELTCRDPKCRLYLMALIGVALVVVLILALRIWPQPEKVSGSRLLTEARVALVRQQFELAEQLVGRIDRQDPLWSVGQLLAGEAATRAGRLDKALAYYQSIPQDTSQTGVLATFSAAELYREQGRLTEAQDGYLYCLAHQPDDAATHERLAFLYGVTGRRWEALPHFWFLIDHDQVSVDSLVLVADFERPVEQAELVKRSEKAAPDDILSLLAQGAQAVADGHAQAARRLLQQVVTRQPDLIGAQAMLGELLMDGDPRIYAEWHARLPRQADDHPDIWLVRGLFARHHQELRIAARCFWEVTRRAPAHRRGNYQLGQVLTSLGEQAGDAFSARAKLLFSLTQQLDRVSRSRGQDESSVRQVAEILELVGRLREAIAWAKLATSNFPDSNWPAEMISRLASQVNSATPTTIDAANLGLIHSFAKYPDHAELQSSKIRTPAPTEGAATNTSTSIRFAEEATAGIGFVYFNGPDLATPGARMFEQTGGGVAVLDYDGDSHPDLYFTQGAVWRPNATACSPSDLYLDRFYRNSGLGAFADVSAPTHLGDAEFSQGCTVGDWNNDGFSDLYVANVGANRLYMNNGDGTFSDVTPGSGLNESDWTTSCAIVDLNADGWPDIYDVNYLLGKDVYQRICNDHSCSPKNFEGSPDRLFLSLGDGSFQQVPDATPKLNAKGLGIVAADIFERGRPCLFVANDQVPCFFLRNVATSDPPGLRLQEDGLNSGLAFNGDGLAMAAMGIAADDVDANGHIDFFVTTFKDESRILYLQDSPGLFMDATNPAGLRAAGLPFVGWGTQFLDADRNGDMDIVMANGHVDDYRGEGGEYHMRPQFFQNTGGGRFVERFSADVGSFFGRKYLGRGLSRLDWNGDGRTDFVVSNIGDRASLVTNQSTGIGHFLNVRVHATATARDAIGTVVEVSAGNRKWSKQLLAGDGYMASNERMLQFGLGDATTVKELKVNWTSGNITTLSQVPVDVTIELVEGSRWGTLWRGANPTSLIIEQPLQISP